jgi:mannose-6-phosphate isomerase-like protein (cupin superfamily)
MKKVNLAEKLGQFTERWSPRIVAELNGQQVKLVKLEGEFIWHHHANEDELFLVLQGHLDIHLPGGKVVGLEPGELLVVPRGLEHKPVASGEVHVLLLEPASTLNTGNVRSERTVESPARI